MNRRYVAIFASAPLLVGVLAGCDFTARANGTVTDPSATPTTSNVVTVPGPSGSASATATATDSATATETDSATASPTETSTTTAAPTTTPVVVGVPQPGDADFVELDCADFPLEQADGTLLSAQDVFDTNRLDIHGLDADGDGTACEDTDPAASANDNVADSPDESNDDAADVAVSPDASIAGITVNVKSY